MESIQWEPKEMPNGHSLEEGRKGRRLYQLIPSARPEKKGAWAVLYVRRMDPMLASQWGHKLLVARSTDIECLRDLANGVSDMPLVSLDIDPLSGETPEELPVQ